MLLLVGDNIKSLVSLTTPLLYSRWKNNLGKMGFNVPDPGFYLQYLRLLHDHLSNSAPVLDKLVPIFLVGNWEVYARSQWLGETFMLLTILRYSVLVSYGSPADAQVVNGFKLLRGNVQFYFTCTRCPPLPCLQFSERTSLKGLRILRRLSSK